MYDRRRGWRRIGSGRRHEKALQAAHITGQQRLLRVTLSRYERELDASSGTLNRERTWTVSRTTERPFVSLPAAELARYGYVRFERDGGATFFAPDAEVLLSDSFLDSHCFRVVRGDDPTLVGLSFEPHGRRRSPDIQGVLWLDRSSAELRHLEFGYTHLPAGLRSNRVGGRLTFERVPSGQWLVRRWWIRMPILRARHEIIISWSDIPRQQGVVPLAVEFMALDA